DWSSDVCSSDLIEHRDQQRLLTELLEVGADLRTLLDGLLEALLAEEVGYGAVSGVVGSHQRRERVERGRLGCPKRTRVHQHEALAVDYQGVAGAALGEALAQQAVDTVVGRAIEV